jgi:serine/threonine protein kinase/tetratricopeptide (TPR) repeat protein
VQGAFPLEFPSQRLSKGDLLAGRFRIVRFIAGGGMGEVYEAQDQELRERVAVKIIRPEVLAQPNAVTRFKREVQLARKVTHPNVCRIFDLFRHKSDTGRAQDETVFISMELLHGETLGDHLKTVGRLSVGEAQPLVQQMVSALSAAHSAGIVHRDFKPGNVVLVSATGERRAVVTDFGLALQTIASDDTASLPTGQGLLGTPAYMSPEQLKGLPATPASDIYALGLVIYEMVTGTRPFQGDTPISAALKRLSERPKPPRRLQPELSMLWDSVILRCLETDPAQRFGDAAEIVHALNGDPPLKKQSKTAVRLKPIILAVALSLLAVLVATGLRYLGVSRTLHLTNSGSRVTQRRSVAVLGFKNLSGNPELNWISTALSEELTDELSAGEQLRTVPGEAVARLQADLSLMRTDTLESETLSKIRRALGSEIVVSGSYLDIGNRLRVDVKLHDAVAGDTIATVSDTADEDKMLELVSRIGGSLREKCGVVHLTSSQAQAIKTAQTANPSAARFYSEGLAELRSFDALGAKRLFERAIEADPDYALAHSALASAWSQLGYDAKAKEEAGKAVDLGNGLSQEDRLSIEAQFHEAAHEPGKAVQSLQALFSMAPDNPEYGLRLANAQLLRGNPADAEITLAALRKLPALGSNDARIDLAEANIARSFGDNKKTLAEASVAEQKAKSEGARIITGLSLMRQSSALDELGQQQAAIMRGEKARRLFSEAGDRDDFAKMNSNLALILVRQSKFEEAKRRYQQSLDEFRDIGDERGQEVIFGQLAWIATVQDDLDGALRLYEKALALGREIDDKPRIEADMGAIALILSYKGDLAGAISKKEELLAIAKENGQDQSQTLIDLSEMFLARGDLATARESLTEADESLVKKPNSRSKVLSSQTWGDILTTENQLAEAQKKYQEALSMAIETGEKQLLPYCQMSLANLEIDERRTADAEALLKQAVDYFHDLKSKGGEAWALGIYVRAELESGHPNTALERSKAAKILVLHDRSLSGLDVHLIVARVEGLTGNRQQAESELNNLAKEAAKQGNVSLAFNVRLVRGEVALKSHDPSGRKILGDLVKDAEANGFFLLAQKARTASQQLHPSARVGLPAHS